MVEGLFKFSTTCMESIPKEQNSARYINNCHVTGGEPYAPRELSFCYF